MNIPILLIAFNRPYHTRKVLGRILEAHPKDLYIFQDGIREGNVIDVERCEQVRQVISELTGCQMLSIGQSKIHLTSYTIHFYCSSVNLGCGPGPMTAINWFFKENEMGIIVEDDTVPHIDFFLYAEELLLKYKEDRSVYAIGSMNIDEHSWDDGSYYFSMMNRNLCAWATWRRAWPSLDLKMSDVSRAMLNNALKMYGCGLREREYWCDILDNIHKDGVGGTSWDMQFCISIWLQHAKGIIPKVNLSSNIGFDSDATHGMNPDDLLSNNAVYSIMPLKHPSNTDIQYILDREYNKKYFQPYEYGWSGFKRLPYRLNKRLKRFFGHEGSWFSQSKC